MRSGRRPRAGHGWPARRWRSRRAGRCSSSGFCDEAQALASWLEHVAGSLSARGISGKLEPARSESSPIGEDLSLALTAAFTVPVDFDQVRGDVTPQGWKNLRVGFYADEEET